MAWNLPDAAESKSVLLSLSIFLGVEETIALRIPPPWSSAHHCILIGAYEVIQVEWLFASRHQALLPAPKPKQLWAAHVALPDDWASDFCSLWPCWLWDIDTTVKNLAGIYRTALGCLCELGRNTNIYHLPRDFISLVKFYTIWLTCGHWKDRMLSSTCSSVLFICFKSFCLGCYSGFSQGGDWLNQLKKNTQICWLRLMWLMVTRSVELGISTVEVHPLQCAACNAFCISEMGVVFTVCAVSPGNYLGILGGCL